MPPNLGLGVRADRDAAHADFPELHDVCPQPVAGLPVDLVLLNTVVHHLVVHGDAVGRAGGGAFTADFAEVVDADVDGLIGHQRHVGQDGVAQVDAGPVLLGDYHSVPAQFPDTGCQGRGHGLGAILDCFVSHLTDVGRQVGVDQLQS